MGLAAAIAAQTCEQFRSGFFPLVAAIFHLCSLSETMRSHSRSLSSSSAAAKVVGCVGHVGVAENHGPPWASTNHLLRKNPRLLSLELCHSRSRLYQVLAYTIVSGLFHNPFVASRIVHSSTIIYPLNISAAFSVFSQIIRPNLFSWNTMIKTLAATDAGALTLYVQMRRRGVLPDKFTFTFLLTSFNSVDDLVNGKSIHASSFVLGHQSNPYVQTELVSMYLACGSLEYSWRLFNELPSRDVVSWTAMISGLAAYGLVEHSLSFLNEMRRDDSIVKPNTATMISAISACASWGSLNHTKNLHAYLVKAGLDSHVFSRNSLIDAYGKCGSIGCAQQVFAEMHCKDLHSWTSMIMGLALNGLGQDAILLFSDMQRAGLMPDSASFVAILAACSHAGLLDEGTQIFESMEAVFGIKPDQKHYGCMVDLFCRAGHLSRAYDFISSMKMEPSLEILGAFLSASCAHENLELGELLCRRTESLVLLYRRGASVLLSNMYANSGQWHKVISIRKMRREEGEKPPGKSWIEIRGIVEEFVAGHKLHPLSVEIEWVLNGLDKLMEGVM